MRRFNYITVRAPLRAVCPVDDRLTDPVRNMRYEFPSGRIERDIYGDEDEDVFIVEGESEAQAVLHLMTHLLHETRRRYPSLRMIVDDAEHMLETQFHTRRKTAKKKAQPRPARRRGMVL